MYNIREVTVKNGPHERKVLVIEFDDPKMAIVGEFLMADAPLLKGGILHKMDDVLRGEKRTITVSGNRCALEVAADETVITDLFDDMEGVTAFDSYTIDTIKLCQLTTMWLKRLRTFKEAT